jgi:hypothetical protein
MSFVRGWWQLWGVGDEHDLDPVMSFAKAMLLMKILNHSVTHVDLVGMTN